MSVSDAKRLRELETENAHLKKLQSDPGQPPHPAQRFLLPAAGDVVSSRPSR